MTELQDELVLDDLELQIFLRAVRDAASTRSGAPLDVSLADIGWTDALRIAPRAATSALFEALGAACGTSGALGQLLLTQLGIPADAGAVVLPGFGSITPPVLGNEVDVRGTGLEEMGRSENAVLLRSEPDGGVGWTIAPVAKLSPEPVHGLDPDAGIARIEARLALDEWERADGSWTDAVALARLALGHELVGTMRTMLDLARSHALERIQFDRPIAGFQAVRHRLAESLVAVEGASAALDGAWCDRSPVTAALAKAACGHSAATVRRHCQQVLAGIGFTTEHDLHRYVRRSMVLDGLFGSARSITEQLGAEVLARRRLPEVLPL